MYAPIWSVSPGIWTDTFVLLILSLSTLIFQLFSVFEVSGGTVSLNSTLTLASASDMSLTLMVSLPKSMPWLFKYKRPTAPFTRASCTKSAVLSLTSLNSSASISTFFFSNGHSCTSTTNLRTSATVSLIPGMESFVCIILKPSTPKSSGNTNLTWSTDISMPVCSEAYVVTCLTIQFCIGGM